VRHAAARTKNCGCRARAPVANLPQEVPHIAFFPAVAHAGPRDDAWWLRIPEAFEPDRREVRARPQRKRHPPEDPGI